MCDWISAESRQRSGNSPKTSGGALRLARLQRPVKIMAGGLTGWIDEGFALESGAAPSTA